MKRYPLVEEIGTPFSASQFFAIFRECPFSFFLDSGMDPDKSGRYSFMGSDPFLVMRSRGEEISLVRGRAEETRRGNPFDTVDELLKAYSLNGYPSAIPFTGGAVGYFSYDLCHFIERLPSTAVDDLNLPECYLAFYDTVIAFDHRKCKTYLVSTGFPELDEAKRKQRAKERLEEVKSIVSDSSPVIHSLGQASTVRDTVLKANFTR